jgi:hypothetical protein
MNMWLSGEDEDGIPFYDKIPDWEKERNMILMNPFDPEGKDYFKVPLPYGYNVFHNFGTMVAEVASGRRSKGDGIGFMFSSLIGAFAPLNLPDSSDGAIKLVKTGAPTILKPFVEIAVNESYFGSSIYNENFPVGAQKPDSELGRPSTGKVFVELSKILNEATGGNKWESGWADYNPDSIEHIAEFMFGGVGKFINNTVKTGTYLVETAGGRESEIEIREIPVIRKVYGESTARYVNQEVYYRRKKMLDQKVEMFKESKEARQADPKFAKDVKKLDNMQKSVDKRLKKIRKKMNDAQNIDDPIKRSERMKKVRDEQDAVISDFNRKYNELIPKAKEDY